MDEIVLDLRTDLERALGDHVQFDVPLSELSRWAIGGSTKAYVDSRSADDVQRVVRLMRSRSEPLLIVGDTSNLLFDSEGFDGVVLRVGHRMSSLSVDGTFVRAEAGVPVPVLARQMADAGLAGLEHAVGIPGTLGGLVVMNGGSQRKGVGERVERVRYIDPDGNMGELDHNECQFGYRSSVLQRMHLVVVEVDLRLERKDPRAIHADMDAVVESRRSRFPEHLPNCGSTFLSDPQMYASVGPPGRAIESVGLKGLRRGGAQISEQHANFIVNNGDATSDDVLWLIARMRRAVHEATGFEMDCEVRYVSTRGTVRPAHEAALERWP